jgi:hypothetical protein
VGGWFLIFYELELTWKKALYVLFRKRQKNVASGRAKVPIFLVNIDDGIEPLA